MRKTTMFVFVLAIMLSASFAHAAGTSNTSLNYVWNGTSWIPWLATSDGKPYVYLDFVNVTSNNLTVNYRAGIGTPSPQRPLHISSAQDANIRLQDTTGANPAAYIEFYNSTSRYGYFGLPGGERVELGLESGKDFVISGGKVGIGVSPPSYPLDVSGAGRFSGNLYLGTSGRYAYDTGSLIGVSSGLLLGGNLDLNGYNLTNYNYVVANDSAKLNGQLSSYYLDTSSTAQTKSGSLTVSGAWLNATSINVSSNAYFGGNVGIGTTSPQGKLHVAAAVDNQIVVQQTTASNGVNAGIQFQDDNTAALGFIGFNVTNYLTGSGDFFITARNVGGTNNFGTGLIVKDAGNVGIGTASPAEKLEVAGNIRINSVSRLQFLGPAEIIKFDSGVTSPVSGLDGMLFTAHGSRYFIFGTYDGTTYSGTRMVINPSGNVGIGTASPDTQLTIVNPASTSGGINFYESSVAAGNKAAFIGDGAGVNKAGVLYLANAGTTKISLSADTGDNIYFNSGGNVGIGDTSPDYKLDVWGTICQDTNSDDTCDGTVTSDIRLKTDITQITDAVAKLEKLKGVEFQWKNMPATEHLGKGTQIGLVAQDVEKVFPSLVYEDMDGYKMVDYQKLTAVLIEAAKEQQKEIESQRQEIETLNARLAALEEMK